MYCGNCGAKISNEEIFCPECGQKISKGTEKLSANIEGTAKSGISEIKVNKKIVYLIICLVGLVVLVNVFAGNSGGNSIVGTWVSEDNGDMLKFDKNGSCSVPFTYNAAWIESADNYTVTDDGTLVLSSPSGHANHSYERVKSEEAALEDRSKYYLSGDILIIHRGKYERTK